MTDQQRLPIPSFVTGEYGLRTRKLVGRDQDVDQIRSACVESNERLVTLTGPGGVGKTSLSIAVAEALGDSFEDGVVFVSLGNLSDVSQVPQEMLRSLNAWRLSEANPIGEVVAALGDRKLLLVLDNFEHLLDFVPDLGRIIHSCPGLQVLATSRSPLRLSFERVYPVPSLAFADPGEMTTAEIMELDAVRLFAQRAANARPGFQVTDSNALAIAEICQRLDGIPLAIELAAVHLRSTTAQVLLDQLSNSLRLLRDGPRDVPARQQTMSDTIAWSYNLLTPEVQEVFRGLAVFPSGVTRTDIDSVLGVITSRESLEEAINQLVDASLLTFSELESGDAWYRMLTPVREFALNCLAGVANETREVRNAHATWLLQQINPKIVGWIGVDGPDWLDEVESLLADLRSAVEWSFRDGVEETGIELAAAASGFWLARGYVAEADHWLCTAAASKSFQTAGIPADRRLAVFIGITTAKCWLSQFDSALALLEVLAADKLLADDPETEISIPWTRSFLLEYAGRQSEAIEEARRAVDLCRHQESSYMLPNCLMRLNVAYTTARDYESALSSAEESLRLFRQRGNLFMLAYATDNLGVLRIREGAIESAGELLIESGRLHRQLKDPWASAEWLESAAVVVASHGFLDLASKLLGAAGYAYEVSGTGPQPHDLDQINMASSLARAGLTDEEFRAEQIAGRSLGLLAAIDMALEGMESLFAVKEGNLSPDSILNESGLSERELDVLRLVVAGRTDQQIADELYVSRRTVNSHVSNILRKLDVGSRAEAAVTAVRKGYI